MIKDSPAIFEFVSESDANKVIYARECLVGAWLDSIHDLMARQGTTQAQIAERVGVTRAAISKVLKGPANVKVDSLIRIGLALGLTWDLQPESADPALWIPAPAAAGEEPSEAPSHEWDELTRWLDFSAPAKAIEATCEEIPPRDATDKLAA